MCAHVPGIPQVSRGPWLAAGQACFAGPKCRVSGRLHDRVALTAPACTCAQEWVATVEGCLQGLAPVLHELPPSAGCALLHSLHFDHGARVSEPWLYRLMQPLVQPTGSGKHAMAPGCTCVAAGLLGLRGAACYHSTLGGPWSCTDACLPACACSPEAVTQLMEVVALLGRAPATHTDGHWTVAVLAAATAAVRAGKLYGPALGRAMTALPVFARVDLGVVPEAPALPEQHPGPAAAPVPVPAAAPAAVQPAPPLHPPPQPPHIHAAAMRQCEALARAGAAAAFSKANLGCWAAQPDYLAAVAVAQAVCRCPPTARWLEVGAARGRFARCTRTQCVPVCAC